MKKRIFSLLLAALMLVSLFPAAALGEGEIAEAPAEELLAEDIVSEEAAPVEEPGDPSAAPQDDMPAEAAPVEEPEEPAEEAVPAEVPVEEPAEEPAEEPGELPAEEPAEVPTEEPGELPAEEPAEEATEEPAEEPQEDAEEAAPDAEGEGDALEPMLASSGSCGANLTWSLSSAGVLTISGTGEMDDYSMNEPGWYASAAQIKSIVIQQGATSISHSAFYQLTAAESAVIPDGMQRIETMAFGQCSSLKTVKFLGSAPSFGTTPFFGVTATAYYPEGDGSWTSIVASSSLGGTFTWVTLPSTSGSCGDDVSWTLDGGTLTISGTGPMWDYTSSSRPPWYERRSEITSVVVQDGVTAIGGYAFAGLANAGSISLPASVTAIGASAMEYWHALTEIQFPANLKSIGAGAFWDCYNLKSVSFPAGLESIGNSAFNACTRLTSMIVQGNLTSIGNSAFKNCTSLTQISFLGNAPSFGDNCFGSVTATVNYPSGNTSWTESVRQNYGGTLTWVSVIDYHCGDNATWSLENGVLIISGTGPMWDFASYANTPWNESLSSISTVVIRNGITHVGDNSFMWCTQLTSVTLPAGLESLGDYAFAECYALTEIALPASLKSIGNVAFCDCSGLTGISFPEGLTDIGRYAFQGCGELTSVTIPASVTSIGPGVFAVCHKLREIDVASGNANYREFLDALYSKDYKTLVAYPEATIFYGSLYSSLTTIGEAAFCGNETLTGITLPETVTSIGQKAFEGCSALTQIRFEGQAPSFGENCFGSVTATASYRPYPSWTEAVRQDYGGHITWECDNKCGDNVTWNLSGGVLVLSGTGPMWDYSFSDEAPWDPIRNSITDVVVQSGVTRIGAYAFYWCSNLTSVTFPTGVESIGYNAFARCKLESLTLPNGLKSIGQSAFYDNRALKTLTIPQGVTEIGSSAFYNCAMTSVALPGSLTTLWATAFESCESLKSFSLSSYSATFSVADGVLYNKDGTTLVVYPCGKNRGGSFTVPDGVTRIGDYAFLWCDGLVGVTFPAGLESIGRAAFSHCTDLKSVTIPASVTSIEAEAFNWCMRMEEIRFLGTAPSIGEKAFTVVDATAYYPPIEDGWPESARQGYGGDLIWVCDNKCGDSLTWSLSAAGKLTIRGTGDMWDFSAPSDNPWRKTGISVTDADIKSGVTRIGRNAFYGAELTSVTIPEGVESIGWYAFQFCEKLTTVTLPTGLKTVGRQSFEGCKELTGVVFPEGVTTIETFAFCFCDKLASVTFPASLTSVEYCAFSHCGALTKITFQGNAPSIESDAFESVTATAYYPMDDATWTESVRQNYGGQITWVAINPLVLNKTELALPVGKAEKLTVQDAPAGLVWTSDKPDIASVDSRGTVKALKAGRATITVKTADGTASAACAVLVQFPDVANPGMYYYEAVYWALENGVTTGLNPSTFAPNAGCTREQTVTFLWRVKGCPATTVKASTVFKDVKAGSWYEDAVGWASENGVTTGLKPDQFGVGKTCTREQFVTFLWRAAGEPDPVTAAAFKDVKPGAYYEKAVSWAFENGVTTGLNATTFGVGGTCTRGQVVTFLKRYADTIG